tara:strand:- start:1999 stop:2172 length:174 start_codon:yes stop_codon:yes gene_type:complete
MTKTMLILDDGSRDYTPPDISFVDGWGQEATLVWNEPTGKYYLPPDEWELRACGDGL